ncbi:unnamed protein product [Triticum turgidum subsp. durum]|uniref:Urease accessory protein UreH-like transmembrane domain-containing protein n=1 Tax=Triticum turgidum subsp. durum TaxID=4567 RepID=A0A9R0W543_TRITD|nr:unnamed protein product [Triticum turgidum subsp. durum]
MASRKKAQQHASQHASAHSSQTPGSPPPVIPSRQDFDSRIRAWKRRVCLRPTLANGSSARKSAGRVGRGCRLGSGAGGGRSRVVVHGAGGAHQHGGNNSNALEKALLGAGGKKKEISFATFATGIVHGLQPDALMIILPALAMPSRAAGAAFLGMFLVGTVLSMASYTVLIGTCTEALKERVPRITEKLTWAASLVAISMGVAIIVSESFGVSLY